MKAKTILFVSFSFIFAIVFYSTTINDSSIWNYVKADSNNVGWTKFSSNGLNFEYPSDWKVTYPQINRIGVLNTSNPSNLFFINLPIHNNVDTSINLVDIANSLYSNYPNANIIEPFTEAFVAGSNAAIGKLKFNIPDVGEVMSQMVAINHDGEIYVFQYGNSPDQFDTGDSQQTMNHIFTSLNFN